MPGNITARPTTDMARENIFNVLENLIDFEGINALDLFAGTGAITFELLSRGAARVTSVEKAATQCRFIGEVARKLKDENLVLVKGDAWRFMASCREQFDFIFADPPYDMPRFGEVPETILNSPMVHEGTVVVMEHPKEHDFSRLPHFKQRRQYGKVNFSIFIIDNEA